MKGCIACGHPQTAEAGQWAFSQGGNAFDAAIAAFWAACVAEPALASPGGGGFLLAASPDWDARLYDFFVHTPQRKRQIPEQSFFPIQGNFGKVTQTFHIGAGAVATPGAVRGIFAVQRDMANLPMKVLVQPALDLARNGVVVNAHQAYVFQIIQPIFQATSSVRALFRSPQSENDVLQRGDRFHNPELADFLEVLAREGERLFYEGEVADLVAAACESGFVQKSDLLGYRCVERNPLEWSYHHKTLLSNPVPSSGGSLVRFGLQLLQQAYEKATLNLGFLAEVFAATESRRNLIAQRPEGLDALEVQRYYDAVCLRARAYRGTTQISAADQEGNLASLTVSNGEGCGFLVPKCGFMLNNMLGEEDLNPGGWHRWPVDQRMTSMMAPSMLIEKDRQIVLGSGGSNRIRTALVQVLAHLLFDAADLKTAVQAPRIHVEAGKLDAEPDFKPRDLQALLAKWPNHHVWDDHNLFFGGVHAVERCGRKLSGIGDPRRGGSCLVG